MHADDAAWLFIVGLGAFIIPLLCGRIGIPAAVGEILFGLLVGPHVLGIIGPGEFPTLLGEFGFALLMFLVGLELEFARIERRGLRGLLVALAVTAALFATAAGAAAALQLPGLLFVALGAISVGIPMVTLAELGLNRTAYGQNLIFVASVAEFATILLLTGFALHARLGWSWALLLEFAKLGVVLLAAFLVLVVLRALIWWRPERFSRLLAAHDPSEVGVRAAMAAMLVFVALAALMGVEAILGAFVAGALFAFVFRDTTVLRAKMSSLGFGFFVPIFFIWVGTEFDPAVAGDGAVLASIGLLLLASLGAKLVGLLPMLADGCSLRETLGAGVLLAAPLTLLVAIARIGRGAGLLDDTQAGALVMLALVSAVLLPPLFRLLAKGRRSAAARTPGADGAPPPAA